MRTKDDINKGRGDFNIGFMLMLIPFAAFIWLLVFVYNGLYLPSKSKEVRNSFTAFIKDIEIAEGVIQKVSKRR